MLPCYACFQGSRGGKPFSLSYIARLPGWINRRSSVAFVYFPALHSEDSGSNPIPASFVILVCFCGQYPVPQIENQKSEVENRALPACERLWPACGQLGQLISRCRGAGFTAFENLSRSLKSKIAWPFSVRFVFFLSLHLQK